MNNLTQAKMQEEILKNLGLEGLSPEMQNGILEKIGELIIKRMFLATMDKLDAKGTDEFNKMAEEGKTSEEIEAFLREKISGYDEMLEKIVVEVKEEMKKDLAV